MTRLRFRIHKKSSNYKYNFKHVTFLKVTEICGPKYRTWFGILTQFPFGIGAAILPLIAYFVRQWVTLQIVIAVPSVLLVLYFW